MVILIEVLFYVIPPQFISVTALQFVFCDGGCFVIVVSVVYHHSKNSACHVMLQ